MPKPLTPLEHSIEEFEKAAIAYHKLRTSNPINTKERQKLDEELKTRLNDLNERMRKLQTQSYVQERVQLEMALTKYQNDRAIPEGKRRTTGTQRNMMDKDPHHPTKALRQNMEASGEMAPDKNCACHHIVAGRGKTIKNPDDPSGERIQTENAIMARAHIQMYGVGINDPENGVYLPRNMSCVPHWRFPKALPHANIHTLAYEEIVWTNLRNRKSNESVRSALRNLRAMLEQGDKTCFLTQKAQTQYARKLAQVFNKQTEVA